MSEPAAPAPAESFRAWLRRETRRELKWCAGLLVAGLAAVIVAGQVWPGFEGAWNRLNYQLTGVALNQHPLAHLRNFGQRLENSEYGWRLLSWNAPFNVTVAREELRREYPEVIGVFDGQAVIPRDASLRRLNAARHERRITDFLTRYYAIELNRFTWLYGDEDVYSLPERSTVLGRLVTKFLGLPDAFLWVLHQIVAAGLASILMFGTVLGLSAVALRESRRPARRWIKVLLWPLFASALVWVEILFMAISAALLSWATPNTAALTLFATLPLMLLAAKAPFRFAESLLLKAGPNATAVDILRTLTRSPFGTGT